MPAQRTVEVVIVAGRARLKGIFGLPSVPKGAVAFAHGSGSGRLSPRNRYVSGVLLESGLATLLTDLLEEGESLEEEKVFDIGLLSNRLRATALWLRKRPEIKGLPIGYFGASTGAAAALRAAAEEPDGIRAIVSRGGRPDLAMEYLPHVLSPTLLIVGGEDRPVISLNELAFGKLTCPKEISVIPGATHLFEEPGALQRVAELARDWFLKYLLSPSTRMESGTLSSDF